MNYLNRIGGYLPGGGGMGTFRHLGLFFFTVLSWILWFIAIAVSQHKSYRRAGQSAYSYHVVGSKAYSFAWWSIFFQLFIMILIHSNSLFFNNHLARTYTTVALIQAIIVADRYVFSPYGSERALVAGAIFIAFCDFLWLYHYSVADDNAGNRGVGVGGEGRGAGVAGAGAAGGAGGYNSNNNNSNRNNTYDEEKNVGVHQPHEKNAPSISDTHNTHSTAVGGDQAGAGYNNVSHPQPAVTH